MDDEEESDKFLMNKPIIFKQPRIEDKHIGPGEYESESISTFKKYQNLVPLPPSWSFMSKTERKIEIEKASMNTPEFIGPGRYEVSHEPQYVEKGNPGIYKSTRKTKTDE